MLRYSLDLNKLRTFSQIHFSLGYILSSDKPRTKSIESFLATILLYTVANLGDKQIQPWWGAKRLKLCWNHGRHESLWMRLVTQMSWTRILSWVWWSQSNLGLNQRARIWFFFFTAFLCPRASSRSGTSSCEYTDEYPDIISSNAGKCETSCISELSPDSMIGNATPRIFSYFQSRKRTMPRFANDTKIKLRTHYWGIRPLIPRLQPWSRRVGMRHHIGRH